jgi:flavin-dependent dehydrogenase
MYDAIVIGARAAGSPTAMLLARRGYRVLVVDRASFPSDTLSTHLVQPFGILRLQRWGLLDRLRATGAPPIARRVLDLGGFALTGTPLPIGGVSEAYAPRRTVLDKLLTDAAVEAGAELWEGFVVEGLVGDGERVTGIRGHRKGGPSFEVRAPIVIGADGRHSLVARAVEAPAYNTHPAAASTYYSYWAGIPARDLENYRREESVLFVFPTNDDLTLVAIEMPQSRFHAFRADIPRNFQAVIARAPRLAERLAAGQRVDRFYGTADLPNFFRKPYGPGWALVGDAGYHKDPILGQGIGDAFRDAEILADAVDLALSGAAPWEQALAGYERRRNTAALATYEFNYQLSTFGALPAVPRGLFPALRGNQAQIDRYLSLSAGSVAVAEFFAEANLAQIMGSQLVAA